MTTDLEDLVRATFDGRAATVDSGPEWAGTAPRRGTNRWLVAGAVAAAVIAAGTALTVTRALRHDDTSAATGSPRPACTTVLPRAWARIVGGPSFTLDGRSAWPAAVAPNGTLVAEAGDRSEGYQTALVTTSGRTVPLLRSPGSAKRVVSAADTDGRYVVYNVTTDTPGADGGGPIDDILLVDGRGHRPSQASDLLAHAPVPHGYVVAWRGAVIQGGVVYFGVVAPGNHPRRGVVVSYDSSTKKYRVVADLSEQPLVLRDPRGVHWQGGLVPAGHVPSAVPAAPSGPDWRQNVVSDGHSFAWPGLNDSIDARTLYWLRGAGRHQYRVQSPGHRDVFMVQAVSGPFVFGQFSTGPLYVVDARTGAMAPLDPRVDWTTAAGTHLYLSVSARAPRLGTARTVRIDTSRLPELRC